MVEGESDTHTLWTYGIPALGLPGATTWKPEWLEYLQGFRVYVWKEPGQVGEQFLNSIAMSDPDIWIIQPPPNRNDISECHVAGDDIPVLIEKLRNESIPYKSVLEKQRKDEADKAYKVAKTLLHSNILAELDQLIGHLGVVGEERNAKLLYLVVTSRLLDQPVSVVVKGPSSGGKSFTAKAILKLFPERAFYALSGMSEHALAYSVEPLNHRMLVVYEAAGLDTKFASYLLRTLLSEGHIRYETVESTNDGLVPRLINRDGPTGVILTTTWVSLHPENETRLLSLNVRDDRHQTKKIMLTLAEQAAGSSREELDLSSWHALQTWLDLSGLKGVTIPYAQILAENTIEASIRMRRDFGLVLSLIKTNAILYQCQRDHDKTGNIIATLDDYATVYTLIIDLLSDAAQISVSKIVRETVQAVQNFLADKPDGSSMSIRQLADYLQLDKAAASRRAKTAAELGYLTNLEDRKGKPAQFTLAEALPDDKEALPHPNFLKKLLQEASPENSSTVQHSFFAGELTAISDRPTELIFTTNPWPDISRPCPVCGTMSWLERPIAAGGGSYCSVCHP